MAERIVAELGEVSASSGTMAKGRSRICTDTFVFTRQAKEYIEKRLLRRVRSDITSLEIESQELSHAAGRKLS